MKRALYRAEIGLILLAVVYAAICYGVSYSVGKQDSFSLKIYSEATGLATFFLALGFITWRVFYIMIAVRPRQLTHFIVRDFKNFLISGDRIRHAIPVFIAVLLFMSAFTSTKMLIPLINPFSWDEAFMQIDRVLHFGIDPWRLLQPLLGYPIVTTTINFVYNLWFFVMFGALYWQLFSIRDPQLRMQFFYSFFLCWVVVGTLLAFVFSSGGPCFYYEFTGNDYYAPLMDYLRTVSPLWALDTQTMLLDSYKKHGVGLGSGISAMPSMHISVAIIMAFAGWRTSRAAGIGFTIFAVFIFIGSVHLAWHYAIDGYVSLIVTALIWWLCGKFTARLRA